MTCASPVGWRLAGKGSGGDRRDAANGSEAVAGNRRPDQLRACHCGRSGTSKGADLGWAERPKAHDAEAVAPAPS